jgi:uncharacterized membrane protein
MVNIERVLSWVLRIGVMASASFMVIGFFTTSALIWAGVAFLILTPLMRIVMAGILFLAKNDRLYFIIALYVMLVLVIGSMLKF